MEHQTYASIQPGLGAESARLFAGRYAKEASPENATIYGVRARPQHRKNCAIQTGHDEVKLVPAPSDQGSSYLNEAVKRSAVRRQEAQVQAGRRQRKAHKRPKRSHKDAASTSINQQGGGNRSPQEQESSARHSRGEHREESLHIERLSVSPRLDNPDK
jgi:hypothetical protein